MVEEVEGDLEEVTRLAARTNQGMTRDMAGLIALGRSKGYKSPERWAMHVMAGRRASRN